MSLGSGQVVALDQRQAACSRGGSDWDPGAGSPVPTRMAKGHRLRGQLAWPWTEWRAGLAWRKSWCNNTVVLKRAHALRGLLCVPQRPCPGVQGCRGLAPPTVCTSTYSNAKVGFSMEALEVGKVTQLTSPHKPS